MTIEYKTKQPELTSWKIKTTKVISRKYFLPLQMKLKILLKPKPKF